jgi:hypothetical protein
MPDDITNKISFYVRGGVLLLEFSSDALQTNIRSTLLINHISRVTNCHHMQNYYDTNFKLKLTYLYTITIYHSFTHIPMIPWHYMSNNQYFIDIYKTQNTQYENIYAVWNDIHISAVKSYCFVDFILDRMSKTCLKIPP